MNKKAYDENILIESCLSGDSAAFEVIVNQYKTLVCAITYSAVGQVEQSEDLAQQVFVNAWQNLSQLKDISRFKWWLISITRNAIKDFFKKSCRDVVKNATRRRAGRLGTRRAAAARFGQQRRHRGDRAGRVRGSGGSAPPAGGQRG